MSPSELTLSLTNVILKNLFWTFLTLTALPLLCALFVIQSTLCIHVNTVPRWFSGCSRVRVCVCGWWLFMHLYALIHMQRDVLIIVTSLLEISFQFSYLFKSSYISYSYAPAYACVYMLCMVLL